ncbi:cytochrome c551 peroxidase precursor [Roseovarius sp. A-2]|nr:cytochrome c551 peroxidase precursor [Roseovarius sp. A-2]
MPGKKALATLQGARGYVDNPCAAWLNCDDGALSDEQAVGLELFMDKGGSACHNSVNLGGNDYDPIGLIKKPGADVLPPDDRGRVTVTETADNSYVFRAAPLRNIDQTAPRFHSGKVRDLKVAVQIMGTSQLGTRINDQETDQIAALLGALIGRMPKVIYPVLPAET